jgi:hypothetical protein
VRWHHHRNGDGQGNEHELWPGADVLCEEAGAFLLGRSAELFVARREAVPAWALINGPTHRGAAEVLDLAEQVPPSPRARQRWDVVPAAVAAALVVLSYGTASTLAQLQLERLFPLELALMDGDPRVSTPGELVHLAIEALRTGRWHCRT